MTEINVHELSKAMYPSFLLNENLAYNPILKITSDKHDEKMCYMSYYLQDDVYDVFFALDLNDIYSFEWRPIYIFKITCSKQEYNILKSENIELADIEDFLMSKIMYNSGILSSGVIYKDFIEKFPKILNTSNKLNKYQMNETKKNYYKRDLYLNLTTGDLYPLNENGDIIFFRLIKYRKNNKNKYRIDVNSIEKSYNYEDYNVWFYCIPVSNFSIEELVESLLINFKEIS